MRNKNKANNKSVTIIGPYRYHNFGDDLVGAIMVRYLKMNGFSVFVPGLSKKNCAWLKIKHASSITYTLKKSSRIIIGGGGILGDSGIKPDDFYRIESLKAVLYGWLTSRKVIITGIGAGPLQKLFSRILTRLIVSLAYKVGIRDHESKLFLEKLGINGDKLIQGSDIALLWQHVLKYKAKPSTKLGIQFDINAYLEQLKKFGPNEIADILKEYTGKNQKNILLITNNSYPSELFQQNLPYVEELRYTFLPNFLNKLSSVRAIFTSHLHLAVAAYAARIPCFSIYVRDKTKRFYEQINHPERAIHLKSASKENVADFLQQLEDVKWTTDDEKNLIKLKKSALRLVNFKKLIY